MVNVSFCFSLIFSFDFYKVWLYDSFMACPVSQKMRKLFSAFLRYVVAGGVGFLIDYGVLLLCHEVIGIHYLLAATLGFIAGLVFVYAASNKWVFDQRKMESSKVKEFSVFSLIGIVGLGLTVLFMWAFTDGLGMMPRISKLFTTALVMLWNFGARKCILY